MYTQRCSALLTGLRLSKMPAVRRSARTQTVADPAATTAKRQRTTAGTATTKKQAASSSASSTTDAATAAPVDDSEPVSSTTTTASSHSADSSTTKPPAVKGKRSGTSSSSSSSSSSNSSTTGGSTKLFPNYRNFDPTTYRWKPDIDYRSNPTEYRIGKGEQGVLVCQPYKSEIGPHWRFATPEKARESSAKISEMFNAYLDADDFVGADLARKYLQMGGTRSRRYTNYKGGKKYSIEDQRQLERGTGDPQKAVSAQIFFDALKVAESNEKYAAMKKEWKQKYG